MGGHKVLWKEEEHLHYSNIKDLVVKKGGHPKRIEVIK